MDFTLTDVWDRKYKYGRDFLLQLRLHPCSLQKPSALRDHEIVKDKLYLHHISNCTGSTKSSCSSFCPLTDYPPAMPRTIKQDYETMYRQQHPSRDGYSRMISLYGSKPKCNPTYCSAAAGKKRSLFTPDYLTSCRKMSFQAPSEYKFDFSTPDLFPSDVTDSQNVSYPKQFPTCPEEMWNGSSRNWEHNPNGKISEKVKRSVKKPLAIIDPKNGKNIFEGIKSSATSEEAILSEEDTLELDSKKETHSDVDSSVENGVENEVSIHPNGSECGEINGNLKLGEEFSCASHHSENSTDVENSSSHSFYSNNGELGNSSLKPNPLTEDAERIELESGIKVPFNLFKDGLNLESDTKFDYNDYVESRENISDKLEPEKWSNADNANGTYIPPIPFDKVMRYPLASQETSVKFEDNLKANIATLREKMYAMRQEQQKLIILQSFLRFKKHQLDESFQSLDDKKNEIANWEFSLLYKANRLQEKEYLLESKMLALVKKEEKLDEREKMMGKKHRETGLSSEMNSSTQAKKVNNDGESGDECLTFEELNNSVSIDKDVETRPPLKENKVNCEFGDGVASSVWDMHPDQVEPNSVEYVHNKE